jgi:hypothetical protein
MPDRPDTPDDDKQQVLFDTVQIKLEPLRMINAKPTG